MNKTEGNLYLKDYISELRAIDLAFGYDDAWNGKRLSEAVAILKGQRDEARRLKERFTIFHTDGTIVSQGSFNALISQNDNLKNRVGQLLRGLEAMERLLEDARLAVHEAESKNWGSTPCQN